MEHSCWKKLTPKQKQDKLNSNIRSVGLVTVFVLLVKTLIINFQDVWLVRELTHSFNCAKVCRRFKWLAKNVGPITFRKNWQKQGPSARHTKITNTFLLPVAVGEACMVW